MLRILAFTAVSCGLRTARRQPEAGSPLRVRCTTRPPSERMSTWGSAREPPTMGDPTSRGMCCSCRVPSSRRTPMGHTCST
uniref:Uncharacterized protein n=1 Tax=Ixodes ricinus TaxID=34613 RepID=A0A6B0U5G1_IXORI